MRLPMIWFDFGGVLSPPLEDIYTAFETKTGITPAQLKAAIKGVADELDLPTMAPVETGLLTEREWGSRLRRVLAEQNPGIDLQRAELETFGRQWFDGVVANPEMVRALRTLRDSGFRVGILSNNVKEWGPYWKAIIAPAGDVDCLIDSCEVGCRKPDPQIFETAAKSAGVDAKDCVLIDDVQENCAAAQRAGWGSVHFRDDTQVLRELRDLTGLSALTR
ncbi:HAD family hydrolase [Streptomyces flaveolus]|uniref:HAD family hydrolase n=1 Tax=Streptomyces flaveolus TaxID=67297 RepID=UPI0033FE00C2